MLYPTAVVEVATTRKQSNRLLAYCSLQIEVRESMVGIRKDCSKCAV